MKEIWTKAQLKALALELKVRKDWHEPDEQNVSAVVRGSSFDNAGCGPEKAVIIKQNGHEVASINLAMLLAWACGLEDEKPESCDMSERQADEFRNEERSNRRRAGRG